MNKESLEHYYGDQVRSLFIVGGLVMILSYPFFSSLIGVPIPVAIIAFTILAIFGGFMNPKQKWVIILNSVISTLAFMVFEYSAVQTYINLSPTVSMNVAFFWINQLLSLLFFFAAYLSTKTLRGLLIAENEN